MFFTTKAIPFHCFCIVYSTEVSEFFISFFIWLYSLETFTKANSSQLISELIKALEIRTSIVFNVSFPSSTILSCFFFFFIIYFLIPTMIALIFISTSELARPTRTQTNKANAEMEHNQ